MELGINNSGTIAGYFGSGQPNSTPRPWLKNQGWASRDLLTASSDAWLRRSLSALRSFIPDARAKGYTARKVCRPPG